MARMTAEWIQLAVCLTLVFSSAACAPTPTSPQSSSVTRPAGGWAVVSVDETTTGSTLPADFIGLSYEASLLAEASSFPTKPGISCSAGTSAPNYHKTKCARSSCCSSSEKRPPPGLTAINSR